MNIKTLAQVLVLTNKMENIQLRLTQIDEEKKSVIEINKKKDIYESLEDDNGRL